MRSCVRGGSGFTDCGGYVFHTVPIILGPSIQRQPFRLVQSDRDISRKGAVMFGAVKLSDKRLHDLIEAARCGCKQAFLTKQGSTQYGAAVLTASGQMYHAGQYSSFNHITNIHAEMAAVLMATMAGDSEVVALALTSTGAKESPARPCGVCRQFLDEHAQRTGRDIRVLMSNRSGTVTEISSVSELLPSNWTARSLQDAKSGLPWGILPPWNPGLNPLEYGDQVQTEDRYLSLVWAPEWIPGTALLKIKYDAGDLIAGKGDPPKLAHSFTGYEDYLAQLRKRNVLGMLPGGEPAYIVPYDMIQGRAPRVQMDCADLARKPAETSRLTPFIELVERNGISIDQLSLTASWAVGMARVTSDFDIVVCADSSSVARLRKAISENIRERLFEAPEGSATWATLRSAGKPPEELVREGRFAETFTVPGPKPARCSIIYIRPYSEAACFSSPLIFEETATLEGRVQDGSEMNFKRARYNILSTNGVSMDVECWHKWAGLLRPGDLVRITGVICQSGRRFMLQMNPQRHGIEWLDWR